MIGGGGGEEELRARIAALSPQQRALLKQELEEQQGGDDGLLEPGNVDLSHRPVVHNADGSISTIYSSSSDEDGKEVLVPGVSMDGRKMEPDEAWKEYLRTGQHLGKFKDVASADAYAAKLHGEHWTYHRDPSGKEYATFVGGPGSDVPPSSRSDSGGVSGVEGYDSSGTLPAARDFGRQFAKGLSDAGHVIAAGGLDLVGADKTAERVRQSRRANDELYGDARGMSGKVGTFAGRAVGELPLFLAPEAALGKAGELTEGATALERALAARKALKLRALGGAAVGVTEAGAQPKESLVGGAAELTDSPTLRRLSQSPVARALGGAAGMEAAAVAGGAAFRGGAKVIKKLRPGTEAVAAATERSTAKVGELLGDPADEAAAGAEKVRVSDVKPKLGDQDFENVLNHVSDPEHMDQTVQRVSRLKQEQPPRVENTALRLPDGTIVPGVGHDGYEAHSSLIERVPHDVDLAQVEDGFVDQHGNFLSRDEAAPLQREAARAKGHSIDEPEPLDAPTTGKWTRGRPEPPAPQATGPTWLTEAIDRSVGLADKLGLSDEIEELSAQRLTANEVAKRIAGRVPEGADAKELVRAVRARRSIPSMDEGTEFEKWVQSRGIPGYRTASHGGHDFGEIDLETAARIGRESAPIRLSEDQARHIWDDHPELHQISESADAFVEEVAQGYTQVYKGEGGSLQLVKRNGGNKAIYATLKGEPAGPHYSVGSGHLVGDRRLKPEDDLLGGLGRKGPGEGVLPADSYPPDPAQLGPTGQRSALTGPQEPPPPQGTLGAPGGSSGRPRLLNEPTTEAATLEAAKNVDLPKLLRRERFTMLTGPESQALGIEYNAKSSELTQLERRAGTMGADDPAREQVQQQIALLSDHLDNVLEAHVKGGSEVGRALRLRRVGNEVAAEQTLDPITWFTRAQRQMGPNRELTNEMKKGIRELIDAGDKKGLADFVAKLGEPISPYKSPFKWAAKLMKGFYISGTASPIRAVVGNSARVGLDDVAGAPVKPLMAKIVSIVTGAPPLPSPSIRRGREAFEGFAEGMGVAKDIVKGWGRKLPLSTAAKNEVQGAGELEPIFGIRRIFKRLAGASPEAVKATPATPLAELFVDATFRAQGAVDAPFRAAATRAGLDEYADYTARSIEGLKGQDALDRIAQLKAEPPLEMQLAAEHLADVATFQQTTKAHEAVAGIKSIADRPQRLLGKNVPPLPGLHSAADLIFPFSRTPSSVVMSGVEATPLGFFGAAHDLHVLRDFVKKADPELAPTIFALQKQATRRLTRASVGTAALMAMGYKWRKEGRMTGDVPQGAASGEFFNEGKQPFSVKVGSRWYPIAQVQPFAAPIAAGALMAEAEGGGVSKFAYGTLRASERLAMEAPFLRGSSSLVETLQGGTGPNTLGKSLAGGAVPNIVAEAQRIQDPVQRVRKTIPDVVRARIPYASEKLQPQISPTTGDPLKREYSKTASWMETVDPFSSSPDRTQFDDVLKEVSRVGAAINNPKQNKGESAEEYTGRLQEDGHVWNKVMKAFLFPSDETSGLLDDAGVRQEDFDDYHALKAQQQTDKVKEAEAGIIEDVSRRIRSQLSRERRVAAGG